MSKNIGIFIHPESGNVGIGTSQPRAQLEVFGSIVPSSNLEYDLGSPGLRWRELYLSGNSINLGGTTISRDATTGGIKFLDPNTNQPLDSTVRNLTASNLTVLGDYVTLNTITSNTEQMVIQNDGTGPALKVTQTGANSIAEFYDDGNVLALKIADGGNVGIGTGNPMGKLHVQGSVSATTQYLGPIIDVVSAPGYSWSGDTNTGMYRPGTDTLGLVTNGVERVSVLANGNVGIGTTNPVAKLHILGTLKVNEYSMVVPKVIAVSSSTIISNWTATLGGAGTTYNLAGAYNESLISGLFDNFPNPDELQYRKAYYINCTVTNGNGNFPVITINNVDVLSIGSYSDTTYRVIVTSPFFLSWTQFPYQGTIGYAGLGLTFRLKSTGGTDVTIFSLNVHACYIHASYTNYPKISGLIY